MLYSVGGFMKPSYPATQTSVSLTGLGVLHDEGEHTRSCLVFLESFCGRRCWEDKGLGMKMYQPLISLSYAR